MPDYPTDADLARIEAWPATDLRGLFDFVRELWSYPDFWGEIGAPAGCIPATRIDTHITCSTGGWSGNESLIDALQSNLAAWLLTWYSSRRGGHYEFRIPRQA